MNIKAFFVAALQSALDESIATPDDLLEHVTPDVLAQHLPRPLWARLLTACVGAPKVDAQLVVETIGVPNLCEHVPSHIIWACLSKIANRSLGLAATKSDEAIVLRPKSITTPPPPPQPSRGKPLAQPPPDSITKPANPPLSPLPRVGPALPTPAASGASQSLADIVAELESEARDEKPTAPTPSRGRVPTSQRFRQAQTGSGIGRLATPAPTTPTSSSRRPQAAMQPPSRTAKRGETEVEDAEAETETSVGSDWRSSLAVEEDQLVDWQASEETLTVADDNDRKR